MCCPRASTASAITACSPAENIAHARELLAPPIIPVDAIKAIKAISTNEAEPQTTNLCPCCGGRMIITERVRTRRNSALPSKPASASDQDRHLSDWLSSAGRLDGDFGNHTRA
jgi:hypothetical protein